MINAEFYTHRLQEAIKTAGSDTWHMLPMLFPDPECRLIVAATVVSLDPTTCSHDSILVELEDGDFAEITSEEDAREIIRANTECWAQSEDEILEAMGM